MVDFYRIKKLMKQEIKQYLTSIQEGKPHLETKEFIEYLKKKYSFGDISIRRAFEEFGVTIVQDKKA